MTRAAAEVADGLIVHSFTTEKFLREATLPTLEAGLSGAQRTRSSFTVSLPLFVATGGNDEELDVAVRATRERIAFYGSTPAYRTVLDLHGWGSLQADLNHLARAGLWSQMADAIDDEILHAFAVVGEPAEVGVEITRRFAGAVDRVSLATPVPLDEESLALVVDRARESMPAGTMPSPGRTPPV